MELSGQGAVGLPQSGHQVGGQVVQRGAGLVTGQDGPDGVGLACYGPMDLGQRLIGDSADGVGDRGPDGGVAAGEPRCELLGEPGQRGLHRGGQVTSSTDAVPITTTLAVAGSTPSR